MDEPEQATEEQTAQEQPELVSDEREAAPEASRRSGLGFLLGVVLGAAIGAAAAILLPPRPAEQTPVTLEPNSDALDGAVGKLRSRLREATAEARQAAREAEQAKRARFEQLIERDQP